MARIEDEYPFIFMNTPASLQSLASAEIVVMLWRCAYTNRMSNLCEGPMMVSSTTCDCEDCKGFDIDCKEVLAVPVPRRIEAQINEKHASLWYGLDKLVEFHSTRGFLDTSYGDALRQCLKYIVVDFSGSIGFKETAINMMNSGEFRAAVKYKLACAYCLEDQVKRFWPSVAEYASRIFVDSEHLKCIVSHWNDRMKSGGNPIADTASVKRLMETAAFGRNDAAAFDHFCKMLPDHEKVSEFIALILDGDTYLAHRAVIRSLSLHTLNRVSAEEVFKNTAGAIFDILCSDEHYYQFIHELWAVMRHLVLENDQRFCDVVIVLSKKVLPCGERRCLEYAQCHQISELLSEIWSHASDELKTNVSDIFLRDNLIMLWCCPLAFSIYYGHDMTFLLELLSKWTDVDREQLWRKSWSELALYAKPLYLEQLVRMCLPNEDAIEHFKTQFADFELRFTSLIREGLYADLKDDLIFCSKDTKQFQQLGKKVLESNLDIILLHDDDKFAKFDWFVGEIFANVREDEDGFKTQMISSANCVRYLLAAHQSDKISSNDLSRIIRRFVNNEGELQLVKRNLWKHCRMYPVDYKWPSKLRCPINWFDADKWQAFLEWCTDDRDEISTFKRSLNVDVIFQKRLRHHLSLWYSSSARSGIPRFLDGFLKWYYGNEEGAKNFKLDKIKNYKQIDFLRVKIEKKFIGDDKLSIHESDIFKTLMWFFGNDKENVLEFCKTNLILIPFLLKQQWLA